MDFMTYILITIPLVLATMYVMKVLSLRKIPRRDSILHWPHRSVEFTGNTESFNELVDKQIAKSNYGVRLRTPTSAYLTESPLKWKRTGFCYYIIYDEPGKVINIYYKNILYDDSQISEVVNAMLTHFHG